MAHITTIANKKGGTAKSTTAHSLAHGLQRRGYRVLLIDLDQQANATLNSGINSNEAGLITSLDFMQGRADAIIKTGSVDIIPANNQLAVANNVFTDTGKEFKLKEALTPIKANYDFIIIDTPPTTEALTINAFATSNDIIIPIQADIFNLQGIAELKQVIEAVQKYCNKKLTVAGLLLTRYNARATLNRDIKTLLEDIARTLNTRLFDTTISQCIAISEAQAEQQSIFDYAPRSTGAKQYNAFIDEYLDHIGG